MFIASKLRLWRSPREVEERSTSFSSRDDVEAQNVEEELRGNDSDPASTSDSDTWRDFFRVFIRGPSSRLHLPLKKPNPKLAKKKSKRVRDSPRNISLDAELCYLKPSWKNFSLADLQSATHNFSREYLIGEGGYSEVYKGQLEDGQIVAIKRLTRGTSEEMTMDFLSELGIIVHVDHPNIAKLIGYGVEGGMHIVMELSVNGSLSSILYGSKEKLDWKMRYNIALGTAQGLLYLHQGCQRRIIHKDVKASNILLTEDFQPQIADFGLAKWLPEKWSHHTVSRIEGTLGYLPPEFFMHGIVDEKTDVYAYGVLLLELITGRQALDGSQHSLVVWAKPLLVKGHAAELADPTLVDAYDKREMERLVCVASLCIDPTSAQRPQMSQVVKILNGDDAVLEEVRLQRKTTMKKAYSAEILDVRDLNKHMEAIYGDERNCDSLSDFSGEIGILFNEC